MALSQEPQQTTSRRSKLLRIGTVIVGILTLLAFILGEIAEAAEPKSCLLAILQSKHPLDEIEKSWGERSMLEIPHGMSTLQIQEHNRKLEQALDAPMRIPNSPQSRFVPWLRQRSAQTLHNVIREHPVVSISEVYKRDPQVVLGYCFGRALACHIEALRRGVHPQAIRKIWVVGAPAEDNAYHVATMIKADREELIPVSFNGIPHYFETEWLVLDANFKIPIPVELWMQSFAHGKDGKPNMFFVTQSSRFAPGTTAVYSKVDLFGVQGEEDFYRGYFTDYFKTLREGEKPSLFPREGR